MGVGDTPNRNNLYVSLTGTKKGEDPMFVCKNQKKEIISSGPNLSGVIKDIVPNSYEWPKDSGKRVRGFKMEMVDKGKTYSVKISYNYTSRTIINCLTTVEIPGEVSISVEKGERGYPDLFVRVNDKPCSWKWKFLELENYVGGEGDDKNYDRLYNFLDKVITQKLGPLFRNAFSETDLKTEPTSSSDGEDGPLFDEENVSSGEEEAETPPDEHTPLAEEQDDLPF